MQGWKIKWSTPTTCFKGAIGLSITRSTFHSRDRNVHWHTSFNCQRYMMSTVPYSLQTTTNNILATTFHKFQLVIACCVYDESKSETVLLNFALRTLPCAWFIVLLGMMKWTNFIHIVNDLWCHNQFRGGHCLSNCVQVVLYANVVINTMLYKASATQGCHHV
jgi:hypothetical protein